MTNIEKIYKTPLGQMITVLNPTLREEELLWKTGCKEYVSAKEFFEDEERLSDEPEEEEIAEGHSMFCYRKGGDMYKPAVREQSLESILSEFDKEIPFLQVYGTQMESDRNKIKDFIRTHTQALLESLKMEEKKHKDPEIYGDYLEIDGYNQAVKEINERIEETNL